MYYPQFDPVIVALGPLALRWYGLMYVLAFGTVYLLGVRRAPAYGFSKQDVSDIVFYGVAGVVLGGRVGFVLFYGLERFVDDPLWLLRIWEGGMSFHGGMLGAIAAMWLFARRNKRALLSVSDFIAPLVPIGLGFGRLGNFINAELPGRVTDSVLGVHFPCAAVGQLNAICFGEYEAALRHVSSLYQAFCEGLVLFVVLWLYSANVSARVSARPHPPAGAVSGLFLIGYGALRISTEFFREPDAHIGFISMNWLTMGQLLSIVMVAFGIFLMIRKNLAT